MAVASPVEIDLNAGLDEKARLSLDEVKDFVDPRLNGLPSDIIEPLKPGQLLSMDIETQSVLSGGEDLFFVRKVKVAKRGGIVDLSYSLRSTDGTDFALRAVWNHSDHTVKLPKPSATFIRGKERIEGPAALARAEKVFLIQN